MQALKEKLRQQQKELKERLAEAKTSPSGV